MAEFADFTEESLRALEKRIGLKLTIIDNNGVFNRKQRTRVFTYYRSTHRKNAVCACGFDEKCVGHCRFAMNKICMDADLPFFSTCWKQVSQIVVPLKFNSIHYGMLYAGMFRENGAKIPTDLPPVFRTAFENLPLRNSLPMEELFPLLQIFADGIIFYLRKMNIVNDEYDLRSAKILDFINQHLPENEGLPALAEMLSLSESHTSVLVRRLFGVTFSQLQMRLRSERAAHYLLSTDLPLHRIAPLCGFSNEFHFSRVFRKIKGCAPGIFRKTNMK